MHKLNQRGNINTLLIPFIGVIVLFLAAASFGVWSYMSRQDYKNNTDKKISTAVASAKKQTTTLKDNEFVQKEKRPLKSYNGPEAYGSVIIKYPKTWSAYVVEGGNSTNPVDGYFNPDFVPGVQSTTVYALRVQVVPGSYSSELDRFDSGSKSGKVKVAPFKFPKVPGVVGARINGEIEVGKNGSIVMVPLRDKTLKIFTEANQFVDDFNRLILPNVKFSP